MITEHELKSKVVCFVDNGLFVSFARKIAPAFKKIYYYKPDWKCAFPQSKQMVVGDGFDEIEPILFPLSKIEEIDLWIFVDLYQSDLQEFLEDQGCRVWGARRGDEMELYRWEFRSELKRLGLPVAEAKKIIGLNNLREHLRKVDRKYIKTSIVRGDFETFRHETFDLTEPRLDELEQNLGVVKNNYEFIVEDEIPDAVEVGYDGFTIDGQFPSHAMMAYEVKDCGMIGTIKAYNELAEPVKFINKKISPLLKSYNYRGFLSTEIRYTKKKEPYFIDPCCRLGSPSNELLQELISNWPQILWHGAVGELVPVKPLAKFGCLAMLVSEFAVEHWQSVGFPKELDPFVKLRFHTRVDDKDYVAPQVIGLPDIGCVVATGNTLIEAIAECKRRASQVKGYGVTVSLESISKAMDAIEQGEKMGIKFAENLPSKEAVARA